MRFLWFVFFIVFTLPVNVCRAQTAPAKPTATAVSDKDGNGFFARIFEPQTARPRSVGIVLIGGSEGESLLAESIGPRLAALGYRVVGVNYHGGFADRSRPLANVPLEQFSAAAKSLRASPGVRSVVVIGESRGSEAALLTALRSRDVAGVIGIVPSLYVWSAVGNDEITGPSAWTDAGKPLAFVRPLKEAQPDVGTFTRALRADAALEQATIPIERISVPILLLGSDDDAVWPSGDFVRSAQARVKQMNGQTQLDARTYPNAGHRIFGPGTSSPTESYAWSGGVFVARYGGTEIGNARARASAWRAITEFLAKLER
jgi:uncharacterized protein